MPARTAVRLAWLLWSVALVCIVVALALRYWNLATINWSVIRWAGAKGPLDILVALLITTAGLAYVTVGTAVAARWPGHRIGWLCLAFGLIIAVGDLAQQYAVAVRGHLVLTDDPVPVPLIAGLAALLASVLLACLLLPVTLLLLLFPDGRLPARHWRWLVLMAGLSSGVFVLAQINEPVLYVEGIAVYNPLRLPDSPFTGTRATAVEVMGTLAWATALVALLTAAVAPMLRWRRARGQERQQLKWLAYMAGLIAAAGLSAMVSGYSVGWWELPTFAIGMVGIAGFLLGIPLVIGVAILRYRLYDVDVLINRTLVYTGLTAALALVYFGSVLLLQGLFRGVTGQESNLAIVISTLASAALFQPVRRHLQTVIDRRFYRRKYDTARTLAAFTARLRDEVDLAVVSEALVAAVDETLQPTHVSLWVRPPAPKRPGQSAPW